MYTKTSEITALLGGTLCILLVASLSSATDELKNHAPEKRHDSSFLFFGGWRPIKPGNPFYQGAQSDKYELLSSIPEVLDTSSTYYRPSPSSHKYYKDIYSYYPKPAIKSTHKSKAPVYMERYRRQRKPQKQDGFQSFKIPGLDGIDLQQLKGLHDALINTHQVPLTNLQHGKDVQFVEIALQPVQDSSTVTQYGENSNRGESLYHLAGGHSGGGLTATPMNVEYLTESKLGVEPLLNYNLPNGLSVLPGHVNPKALPLIPNLAIGDNIDLKNIQIIEVPIHSGFPTGSFQYDLPKGKGHASSAYGKRITGSARDAYKIVPQKTLVQPRHQKPYTSQPVKFPQQYSAPIQQNGGYGKSQQHQRQYAKQPAHAVGAEIITVNDDQLKHLLKNIQIFDKNSNEILRYLPLSEVKKHKDEDIHLLIAVPQLDSKQQNYGKQDSYEGNIKQHEVYPQIQTYHQPEQPKYEAQNNQEIQGYQIIDGLRNTQNNYESNGHYDAQTHNVANNHPSYSEDKDPSTSYDQQDHKQSSYGHQERPHQESSYEDDSQQHQNAYKNGHEQDDYQQHQIVDLKRDNHGQPFIQIDGSVDENGYRREPVLAVELKHGQTIEDAIQALDPETLQRIGAHTKDGVEIEVVEIPVEDYASESKKKEVVVPSNSKAFNSTTPRPPPSTASITTTTQTPEITTTKS